MKKIFNKSGLSYIQTAVIILIAVMLFSVVFTYVSLMVTISRTRDDTQRVLDSFIIENASEIYVSVKNGNNTTLSTTYDTRFKALVASELGLTQSGSAMYSETADKNIIFYYNNPVTTNIRSDVLELSTSFEIVLPVSFAGNKLFDLTVPVEVNSLYVLK